VDGHFAKRGEPPKNADSTVIQKRVRSGNWSGYIFLTGLIALRKFHAQMQTVALLVGLVVAGCGVTYADDFVTVFSSTCVAPFGWNRIIDIVQIIVMLFLPFA